MQKLCNLLSLCFSFRGTIAPKDYVIGCLIVMGLGGAMLIVVPLLGTILLLLFVRDASDFQDMDRIALLSNMPYLLYLFLLASQFSLAARRLRDAGRSMRYLLIPPGIFAGLVTLDILLAWWILMIATSEPLAGHEGQGVFAGTMLLAGLGLLFASAAAELSFLIFARMRRKEPAQETAAPTD